MQLTITPVIALLLASPALAAPFAEAEAGPSAADIVALPRDMTPRANFNEAEVFSFETPASCSILGCISVIGQAVCIADAIEADDYKSILTCAKKKELCGCAGCFSQLNKFLEKWGLC
ncbi:hypothetical protein QBC43DRAFT_210060 [Cladorrhinum sp. PSN259]|nr:hypothetical protein QBC43DRAFT_210060 [Cladorrhinum sp. PSN259]